MQAYPCVTAANRGGDRPPERPHRSPYRLTAMGILLACFGAWGVAREVSAQTVNDRLGTAPFARDALTRMPVKTRSDTPDVQHPVGFEPHASKGMDRFHLVAAAERSARWWRREWCRAGRRDRPTLAGGSTEGRRTREDRRKDRPHTGGTPVRASHRRHRAGAPRGALERLADDTLLVHLVGHWTIHAGAPVVTELYQQLDASPPVRRLAFETQALTAWDTRLLTFVRQVLETSTPPADRRRSAGPPRRRPTPPGPGRRRPRARRGPARGRTTLLARPHRDRGARWLAGRPGHAGLHWGKPSSPASGW